MHRKIINLILLKIISKISKTGQDQQHVCESPRAYAIMGWRPGAGLCLIRYLCCQAIMWKQNDRFKTCIATFEDIECKFRLGWLDTIRFVHPSCPQKCYWNLIQVLKIQLVVSRPRFCWFVDSRVLSSRCDVYVLFTSVMLTRCCCGNNFDHWIDISAYQRWQTSIFLVHRIVNSYIMHSEWFEFVSLRVVFQCHFNS